MIAWYTGLPSPVRAAIVSTLFTANTVLGIAYTDALQAGLGDSLMHFLAYLDGHWFALLMGYVYGTTVASSFRARQAATSTLPSSPTKGP
jgi:hypothetical protein